MGRVPPSEVRLGARGAAQHVVARAPRRSPTLRITCKAYEFDQAEDDGESLVKVSDYLRTRTAPGVAGIFAIYNEHRDTQFIGYDGDMFQRIRTLSEAVDSEACAWVRAKVFANASMATDAIMAREAQHWIDAEGGVLPPGNGADSSLWRAPGGVGEGRTDCEAAAGDNMTSPFTQATVHREVGAAESAGAGRESREMTVENVDKVLNDIRGYLFADGGDIEVVDVSDGVISVRFQGNCSSCSAQETTMTMGVQRALKAAFGSSVKEIVSLDAPAEAAPSGATVGSVNSLLDLLRPAIKAYDGSVEATSVKEGVCTVAYQGPDPIWMGVRSAIRDKFPDIVEVQRA